MLRVRASGIESMGSTVTERVRRYRVRQRKAGLKAIQIWVPDVAKPAFITECRRQSIKVARSSAEHRVVRELEWLIADRERDAGDWT